MTGQNPPAFAEDQALRWSTGLQVEYTWNYHHDINVFQLNARTNYR